MDLGVLPTGVLFIELRRRLMFRPICSVPSRLPGCSSQLAESTPKLKPNSPRKKQAPEAARVVLERARMIRMFESIRGAAAGQRYWEVVGGEPWLELVEVEVTELYVVHQFVEQQVIQSQSELVVLEKQVQLVQVILVLVILEM